MLNIKGNSLLSKYSTKNMKNMRKLSYLFFKTLKSSVVTYNSTMWHSSPYFKTLDLFTRTSA